MSRYVESDRGQRRRRGLFLVGRGRRCGRHLLLQEGGTAAGPAQRRGGRGRGGGPLVGDIEVLESAGEVIAFIGLIFYLEYERAKLRMCPLTAPVSTGSR